MSTQTIAISEAEGQFMQLLERVQAGDIFILTLNGQKIAKLSPEASDPSQEELDKVRQLFKEMAEFRKTVQLNPPGAEKITIRELIEEGRM